MANKKTFRITKEFNSIEYTVVKCYGYRWARLKNGLAFDRAMFKDFDNALMDADVGFGNHCVVVLTNKFESMDLVLHFRDLQVLVGTVENIVELNGC